MAHQPAHAAADRIRLGNTADVTRASWNGPAFTMNGAGGIVPASMTRAVDDIRGGTGTLDVVVLAGSSPTSGSKTPECDAVTGLTGVNSCTTWTLSAVNDGSILTRSVNDGAGTDESLSFTRTGSGTGTYYLDLEAYSGSGTAAYQLHRDQELTGSSPPRGRGRPRRDGAASTERASPGPSFDFEGAVVGHPGLRTLRHHAGDGGGHGTGLQDTECGAEERGRGQVVDGHEDARRSAPQSSPLCQVQAVPGPGRARSGRHIRPTSTSAPGPSADATRRGRQVGE
ncbi:hypothetical protein [Streptomyces sp. NPDC093089]|uniref:hypothetical protein n=1 Tax=Streptomyces sp. NPDC093089 TaxID=3366024 RepID=UPI0038219BAF